MPLSQTSLDSIFCSNMIVTHFVFPPFFSSFSFFPSSNTAPMPRQATLSPLINCDHPPAALPCSQCHVSKFISWQLYSETIRFSTESKKLVETTTCKYKHCLCGMRVYVWNDSFIFEALKTLINILEAVSLTGGCLGFFLNPIVPSSHPIPQICVVCLLWLASQASGSMDCHYLQVSMSWPLHATKIFAIKQ